MSAAALALLLAAAVAHATWNYLSKGARNDIGFLFAFNLCAVAFWLPIGIVAYAWLQPDLGWDAALWIVVSGLLNLLYFVLLTQGYRFGDLSLVYPLARGTGPALSVVGAILILGESPSWLALVGAAMVVAGILIMSFSTGRGANSEMGRAISFALSTGAVIATYTLWDNQGVTFIPPIIYSAGLDVVRVLILAPLALTAASRRQQVMTAFRDQRTAAIGVGILSPAAYLLVLVALTIAPVAYVAPAREISIVFGALLGWRLLREPDHVRRLIGATIIVIGIFALALG